MIKKIINFIVISLFIFSTINLAVTDYQFISDIGTTAKMISIGNIEGFSQSSVEVFGNPAALSSVQNYSTSFFTTTFLNEVKYNAYSIAKKYEFGTVGVGYMSKSIGDIAHTYADESDRYIPKYFFDYSNSIMTASYQNLFHFKRKKKRKKNKKLPKENVYFTHSPLISHVNEEVFSKDSKVQSSLYWINLELNEYIHNITTKTEVAYGVDYVTIKPGQSLAKLVTRLEALELISYLYKPFTLGVAKTDVTLISSEKLIYNPKLLHKKLSSIKEPVVSNVSTYKNGYFLDSKTISVPFIRVFDINNKPLISNPVKGNYGVPDYHNALSFIYDAIQGKLFNLDDVNNEFVFNPNKDILKTDFLLFLSKIVVKIAKEKLLDTNVKKLLNDTIMEDLDIVARKKITLMHRFLEINDDKFYKKNEQLTRLDLLYFANKFNQWLDSIHYFHTKDKTIGSIKSLPFDLIFNDSKVKVYVDPSVDSRVRRTVGNDVNAKIISRSDINEKVSGQDDFWYELNLTYPKTKSSVLGWVHGSKFTRVTIKEFPDLYKEAGFIPLLPEENEENEENKEKVNAEIVVAENGVVTIMDKLSYGVNVKGFLHRIDTVSGAGFNTDVGVQYERSNYVLSGSVKNVVPGMKITYSNNGVEKIPMVFVVGGLYRGNDFDLYSQFKQMRSHNLISLGMTYTPRFLHYLELSLGLKPYVVLDEVKQNIAFGMGLNLFNIKFHYAQESSEHIIYKNKHYFSLSFDF